MIYLPPSSKNPASTLGQLQFVYIPKRNVFHKKQVIEYQSDEKAFSKNWHQGELLSKVEPVEVANLVDPKNENLFRSPHGSPQEAERIMSRNVGDYLKENPTYQRIPSDEPSSISSLMTESCCGEKHDRKRSVDSAFSEYMSLQVCQSSAIVSSDTADIIAFSDSDGGYIKFPT